jgi:hypothetical protein
MFKILFITLLVNTLLFGSYAKQQAIQYVNSPKNEVSTPATFTPRNSTKIGVSEAFKNATSITRDSTNSSPANLSILETIESPIDLLLNALINTTINGTSNLMLTVLILDIENSTSNGTSSTSANSTNDSITNSDTDLFLNIFILDALNSTDNTTTTSRPNRFFDFTLFLKPIIDLINAMIPAEDTENYTKLIETEPAFKNSTSILSKLSAK